MAKSLAALFLFLLFFPKKDWAQLPLRLHFTYSPSLEIPETLGGFDLEQDSAGMMYWASVDGVFAFDGEKSNLFRLDNRHFPNPQPQYVTSIYIDNQDVVWAGLRNGLARLDRREKQLIPVLTSKNRIADGAFPIAEDADGQIWAAFFDGDPAHGNALRCDWRTGHVAPVFLFFPDGGPLREEITGVFSDDLGRVRVLTPTRSLLVRPREGARDSAWVEPLRWPGGERNAHLHNLLAKDKSGNYWAVDTAGHLFFGKNLSELARFDRVPEAKNWKNPLLTVDRKNRVWIAGEKSPCLTRLPASTKSSRPKRPSAMALSAAGASILFFTTAKTCIGFFRTRKPETVLS